MTNYQIRRLTSADIEPMRAMLDMFGVAFDMVDTFSSRQPDDEYLRDLLDSENFIAIAGFAGSALGVERYWFLGDYAAFGPEPAEVLERVTQLPDTRFIRGNTDRYVVTGEDLSPLVESDPRAAGPDRDLDQHCDIARVDARRRYRDGLVRLARRPAAGFPIHRTERHAHPRRARRAGHRRR